MSKKVHLRDQRLFVNAGMDYPRCRANDEFLNVELNYQITSDLTKVTCKHCLNVFYSNVFNKKEKEFTKEELCIKTGLLTKDHKAIPGFIFDYALPQDWIDKLEKITGRYAPFLFVWLYDKKGGLFGRPFALNSEGWGLLSLYDYHTGSQYSYEYMRTIESKN
jgi:hypothetical protein